MAGLQTMALVSMGSALFTILGAYDFPTQGDRNKVAAQIVTGIGFLGAGVIIKAGMTVFGLNTAATALGDGGGGWAMRPVDMARSGRRRADNRCQQRFPLPAGEVD
jgi:putative Mg2+ transporter-C (MgtC) family protein